MKKASTYLYAIMAMGNIGVALLFAHTVRFMLRAWENLGAALPDITRQVVAVPWWPCVFVLIGVFGTIISASTKLESRLLSHILCIILIVEVGLLAISAFGLCLPTYIPEARIVQ